MIYNVYFDIFAMVISFFSIILAFTKKDFWKRQNFILFVLLVATFCASLLDILSSVGNSYIVEWSYGLRDVLNYGYLLVQNIMPYLFCLYIVFLIDMDNKMSKKRRRWFHIGLLIPYVFSSSGIHLEVLDAKGWICLLVVGLIHTGITYCMYFPSLKELPGQKVAILSYIDPVVAVLVSVTILGEAMTVWQIVGGVLILGFTLWNEIGTGKEKGQS